MALLLLLTAVLTSQVMASCRDKDAVTSLDENQLLGKWYNYEQTAWEWPEGEQLKCPQYVFSRSDGGLLMVTGFWNKTSSSYIYYNNNMQKATNGSTDGKYEVHREGTPEGSNYYLNVLHIVHDSYAVMWVCGSNPGSENIYVTNFLLTRDREPTASVLEDANKYLPADNYTINDQTNCPDDERR